MPELLLELENQILVKLEGLGKELGVDGRGGSEHRVGDGYNPGVLAAEGGEGQCRGVSNVELEVDQTEREDEHVARLQDLCEEAVGPVGLVGRHEPHQQRSLHDGQDFGAAGVSVGRVLAVRRVVDADKCDSQGVQPRDPVNVDLSHVGSDSVDCVSRDVEPRGVEVVGIDDIRVLAEFPVDKHCSTQNRYFHQTHR